MTFARVLCPVLLSFLLAPQAKAVSEPIKSPLEIEPFAGVIDYAAKHSIAADGISFAATTDIPQPGDEVVYLLELQQSGSQHQWLVRLVAGRDDPGKSTNPIPDDTIYTSTGLELRYTHSPAVLNVEFIGPFEKAADDGARAAVRRGRASVSAESLQMGLERYCESSLAIASRLKAAGINDPVYYGMGKRPKPDVIESGRKAAAAFGLTPDEERLAFSVYFALRSFYQAASEIPACREVLEQVLQKPSLWSLFGNLGLNTNFTYGWHTVQPLANASALVQTPVYVMPVKLALNDTPALQAELAVTSTRPPLRNCAGIVALAAWHPTDLGRHLRMRLLSARPAKQ